MVKVQGFGQYQLTVIWGHNFVIFIFLISWISFGDESRAAMTQYRYHLASLGSVLLASQFFTFLSGFSSEQRLDQLLDLSRFSDGCCSLGVVLVIHNKRNVEEGLLLAGVFFSIR